MLNRLEEQNTNINTDNETLACFIFDRNIDMKFFIENQELMNINYIDRDYVVNFVVTQAGQYTIQAFIPNTQKTEEASDILIIDVLQGENNE